MIGLLRNSPISLSSVRDPDEIRRIHFRDSLSGLILPEASEAARALDLGSGAGFPGVPLALALPETGFTLVDSVGRKAEFIAGAIAALGLENAEAVHARSEDLARGPEREVFDLVTARAVAPLDVLAELAAPLLTPKGVLVAWKGERERDGEAALSLIGDRIAMRLDRVVPVRPYPESRERHLYVVTRTGACPDGLPRRPGMARKRPLAGRRSRDDETLTMPRKGDRTAWR